MSISSDVPFPSSVTLNGAKLLLDVIAGILFADGERTEKHAI